MPVLVRPATPDDADAPRLPRGGPRGLGALLAGGAGRRERDRVLRRPRLRRRGGRRGGRLRMAPRERARHAVHRPARVGPRRRAGADGRSTRGPAGGDAVDRGAEHASTPRLRAVRLAAGRRQAREGVCGRYVHRAAVQDCARGTAMTLDPYTLPENLPVPEDDGAADHLTGVEVPGVVLESSQGSVDVSSYTVVYVYPR